MNQVRIIGGAWRRSLLYFPNRPDLRPTLDRVRETLFNWLGQDLTGLTVLDAFAGSGALGFEAASRGAQRVVCVERDPAVCQALHDNAQRLHATTLTVVQADSLRWMARGAEQFDVVLLDPPFRDVDWNQILPLVAGVLRPDGLVYLECPSWPQLEGWTPYRQARAGQVSYGLLRRGT